MDKVLSFIFECIIGIFAGYCCCYFIAMKTVKMTPEKVLEIILTIWEEKLSDNHNKNN